ncbi:MAG: hypothetical protein ABI047_05935 [Jatrophihabitantaceae bacterium]
MTVTAAQLTPVAESLSNTHLSLLVLAIGAGSQRRDLSLIAAGGGQDRPLIRLAPDGGRAGDLRAR